MSNAVVTAGRMHTLLAATLGLAFTWGCRASGHYAGGSPGQLSRRRPAQPAAAAQPAAPSGPTRMERDLLGEKAVPGGRLLRRPDGARARELQHLGNPDQPLPGIHRSVGNRETGRRAREHRRRRDEAGGPRRNREGRRCRAQRQVSRPVQGRLVPGRRRHLHQHERQRGARERRPGADRSQEGPVPRRRAARRPEHVAVDERFVSDRDQGGLPCSATTSSLRNSSTP